MNIMDAKDTDEVRAKLASNPQFAEVLRSFGVEPPMKTSLTTGKETYALAKNDEGFIELSEHGNPVVQQLCSVRLGTKSTIEESRVERFIGIGARNKGLLPIPLKYYGAHTGRWSGLDSVNLQTLPSRDKAKKALKNSIMAPPGHYIINCDSSQIEARVLAWWAGQDDVVEQFRNIEKEIARLQPEFPPGTRIEIVRDASIMIRDSVEDVQTTLILGGILTVFIVFCFLNSWRSTVITGLTLPISVVSSFIVMNFMGMTLNVMTLMALSLAIGLLIDDAIVVRENIVRHLEHGEDHFEAARAGTAEIGLAVLATTFSIVAVFVPVAFMKGIVGRFFFQFGITVTFAVLVSLLVSFTLDPMLSSRWSCSTRPSPWRSSCLSASTSRLSSV